MDLEKLQEMWAKDSVIDDVMLDTASLKIPQIHQKYLSLHTEYTLLLKRKEQELKKLQHTKWLYYSGKAPASTYDSEPFPHKVIKSDVVHWVQVDDDVMKVEMKIEYYATILSTLNEILKQVNQLGYHIKSAITWRTFVGGT